MDSPRAQQQTNLDLVVRAGALLAAGFANRDDDLFADDFIWHYFNPYLPDLAGDYEGIEGLERFFQRLAEGNEGGFRIEPTSLAAHGDELVVACATNTIDLGGKAMDFDAVVVWRAFDGRLHEAWDIPAVNTMRPHDPGGGPPTTTEVNRT